MRFDELNKLNQALIEEAESLTQEELEDSILDLLILSYVYGNYDANEDLSTSIDVDTQKMLDSITKKIAGEDYTQRVQKSLKSSEKPLKESLKVILDTEGTRNYNQAKLDVGFSVPNVLKQWETLEDDRVRETHAYLQGVKVHVYDKFYTFDGDSALAPGDFEDARNNCGCRCYLVLSR